MSEAPIRTVVICNERAGGGAMADVFRRLEHRLIDAMGRFDVAFTDAPGHAVALTREALRTGAERVVAAGGDGTLNEVVNGFFDEAGEPIAPDAALGVLAGGTGGDFRKTLRIPDAEASLKALASGATRRIDVGPARFVGHDGAEVTRHFINVASLGLSGRVVDAVGSLKQLGGKLAYAGATLKSLWGWRNPRVQLSIDDHFELDAPIVTIAVGNGRFFGGGMKICPDARLDSGELDVTILGDLSRFELLAQTLSIYEGAHIYHDKVVTSRGRVIRATSRDRVSLDIDGEPLGTLPASFEVLPGAIAVCTP